MIQKLISVVVVILLLFNLSGCGTDLGNGIRKELEDNKEGIQQEISELWDGFLKEVI